MEVYDEDTMDTNLYIREYIELSYWVSNFFEKFHV